MDDKGRFCTEIAIPYACYPILGSRKYEASQRHILNVWMGHGLDGVLVYHGPHFLHGRCARGGGDEVYDCVHLGINSAGVIMILMSSWIYLRYCAFIGSMVLVPRSFAFARTLVVMG